MHFYETSFLSGQVQNTKHPSLPHGVVSLHTHALQISLGPAGGQVRTPQATGEHRTHKQPRSLTFPWTGTHWGGLLVQQMVESIKQEPMECAIEQPPLKKIKQEVSTPQEQLRGSPGDKGKMNRGGFFFLFLAAAANVGRRRLVLPLQQLG